MSDETRKIEVIMNGQKANASIKEMKASAKLLWNQLQQLTPGSQKFINKSKEFQKVSGRLQGVYKEARGVNKGFQLLSMTATQFLGVFSGFAIMQKIGQFFGDTERNSRSFEKSLSTLSSITGAVGEDLEFYRQKAQEMGETTTLSSNQVADAFTLIGSRKPELLQSKEALAAVTKETITLAEAANIELGPAADAVTTLMNQWGEASDQTGRVVNVLAAGSKYGAGNIEYLNDSMKRFGPSAKSMKISIEQSASVMEVFAEKGLESEKAGTQFRNILVELASGADETNPEIVGLDKAIENLGKQQLSTSELAARFGKQNLAGAQILVNSAERVKYFTEALTGTNVAYEQQAINIDNAEGDLKALGSAYESITIDIGDGFLPAKRAVIQALTKFLLILKETPQFLYENRDLFLALGIALVTFNANQIAVTASTIAQVAAEKGRAIATRASAIAQQLLNAAMTANPIGLVIKAIGLLTAGFLVLYNRSEKFRGAIAGIWEAMKQLASNAKDIAIAFLTGDFSALFTAFKNIGNGVGDAFTEGYKEKLSAEQATKEETEKVVAAVEAGNDAIVEDDQKTLEELEAQKEAFREKRLAADRRLEDLRLELIDDSYEREREKMRLKFERDIEDLARDSETYLEEKKLLLDLQHKALDELDQKHEEEKKAKQEEKKLQAIEQMEAEKEKELLRIENAFVNAVEAETEREEALYEVQHAYAQKKLDLMAATYGAESQQALKAKNELLNLERSHTAAKLENEAAYQEARQNLLSGGFDFATDILNGTMALMDEESKARRKAMRIAKAVAITQIGIDLQREIQGIWSNSNKNWLNAVIPGWGAAYAAVQTAAALGRSAVAVKKVRAQQFATGGMTGIGMGSVMPMVEVDGVWQMAQNRGSYAPGGMVNNTSLGVIGEKGPEWVAPNWMLQRPDTANVIAMLEATRQGRAFAEGGPTQNFDKLSLTGGSGSVDMSRMEAKLDQLSMLIAQQNAILASWPENLKVINSLLEVEDGLKTLQQIRDDASVR